jgi:hypothetical protein
MEIIKDEDLFEVKTNKAEISPCMYRSSTKTFVFCSKNRSGTNLLFL